MGRHHRCAGSALLVLFSSPSLAADAKKQADKKDGDKLVALGQINGTITNIAEGSRNLTVNVVYRYMEPNASAFQNQQNLARRQFEIMRNPNPYARQQQLAQLANDIA